MEIPFVRPRSFDHTSLSHDEHFPDRAGRGIRSRSISARHNSATHPRRSAFFCSAPFPFPLERHHSTGTPRRHSRTARHDTARHGTARHDTTRHSTTRHGTARHFTDARAHARNTEILSSKRREPRSRFRRSGVRVRVCVRVTHC